NSGYLRAIARLKPDVPLARARAELASIGDRLSREHPEDGGRGVTMTGVRDQFFGPVERPLFILAGVVVFVLAIACANVAGPLLVRSFVNLTRIDVGLDTHHLLTFDLVLTGDRAEYQSRQIQFYEALQQRLSQVPGVRSVGASVTLPIGGDDFATTYHPEGRSFVDTASLPRAGYQVVTPGYFAAMGIPLKAGRDVRMSDT